MTFGQGDEAAQGADTQPPAIPKICAKLCTSAEGIGRGRPTIWRLAMHKTSPALTQGNTHSANIH